MQLAFFANEVRKKVPNAFIEIEESETEDNYVVAKLKWKNANDFLRNYFAHIGKPLDEEDVLIDTLRIKETMEGDCFSFDWGSPELNTEKLRLASISAENVERMNIRAGAGQGSRIIGKLEKGDDKAGRAATWSMIIAKCREVIFILPICLSKKVHSSLSASLIRWDC